MQELYDDARGHELFAKPGWVYLILTSILSLGNGPVRFLGYIRAMRMQRHSFRPQHGGRDVEIRIVELGTWTASRTFACLVYRFYLQVAHSACCKWLLQSASPLL